MKTILYTITTGILIIFFSCGRSNKKNCIEEGKKNVLKTSLTEKQKEPVKSRKKFKKRQVADSLRRDKILKDAMKIANRNIIKDRFYKKYDVLIDSILVTVEINMDYHFNKTHPHLIIKRSEPGDLDPTFVFIDIYSKYNGEFKKVLSHKQFPMTYLSDTIMDINGDGLNDFVVIRYGSSGCCLKAFKNVYLLRPDKKTFSKEFEFINPTFSPD
jgi:hypothetical protein